MLDPDFVKSYNDKHTLDKIYYKGMTHIWDGKILLPDLIQRHSGIGLALSEEKKRALSKVLSLIVWGEYAAWQTSNALSYEIKEYDGKMAATSQAHDEARHYFTMCDYMMNVLGVPIDEIKVSSTATAGLEAVVNANSLPKKLLGMQLMVEPVAVTIFRQLQASSIEPVLCDLLPYYVRDEARHIALGVKQLPKEIEKLSWFQIGQLMVWQARLLKYEIDGLLELRDSLEVLGLDYYELFREAEKRQIDAANEMIEYLGWNIPFESFIKKVTRSYLG